MLIFILCTHFNNLCKSFNIFDLLELLIQFFSVSLVIL